MWEKISVPISDVPANSTLDDIADGSESGQLSTSSRRATGTVVGAAETATVSCRHQMIGWRIIRASRLS